MRDAGHLLCCSAAPQPVAALASAEARLMPAAGLREHPLVKTLLIAAAVGYVALMLLLPLGAVLAEAFKKGWDLWLGAISAPDARASIRLTLIVAAISVNLNTIFGIAAARAIAP